MHVVLSKAFQDFSGTFVMEFFVVGGMDEDIVHINYQPPFRDVVGEDVVHQGLEGGRRSTESEEHNIGFE